MQIFGRRRRGRGKVSPRLLPPDILERLRVYLDFRTGRHGDTAGSTTVYELIYRPLHPIASANPDRFAAELAAITLPAGGLAAQAGERLVADLLGGDFDNPHYHAMQDRALDWLRAEAISPARLTDHEIKRWVDVHGSEPW